MAETILEANGITYTVQKKQILKAVNLTLRAGDFYTLTGPSGGGKSTLLRILASLLTATKGQIMLKGKALSTFDPIEYRRHVSYAFQQPQLFGTVVLDNLKFPFDIRNEAFDQDRALDLLAQVNLAPEMLNQPINDLSGGEKQRVALLRNILFKPDVLLLDEVTTGLDEDNKNIIQKLVRDLLQDGDIAILSITHDSEELKMADQLITLKDGMLEGSR